MSDALPALEAIFSDWADLSRVIAYMHWDQETLMPKGAASSRGEQIATLEKLQHRCLRNPKITDLLDGAEAAADATDHWRLANLRRMRWHWNRTNGVSSELVEQLSCARSACARAWIDARESDDYNEFSGPFAELLDRSREIAAIKSEQLGCTPYSAFLNDYQEGLDESTADSLLLDLEYYLLDVMRNHPPADGGEKEDLSSASLTTDEAAPIYDLLLEKLGYESDRGVYASALHPFTMPGIPDDVRLAMPESGGTVPWLLIATAHETGHAVYEQGLPAQWARQPVGFASGAVIHESQALLFERHVLRHPAFMAYFEEQLGGQFSEIKGMKLGAALHTVSLGPIRVSADELTYHLHILLRYRIEKQLLSGDLSAVDMPDAWNQYARDYLGAVPDSLRSGCLQDPHWAHAMFGYFPTYTLGAMAAAQFFSSAMEACPDIEDEMAAGNTGSLRQWTHDNIHQMGARLRLDELITSATGNSLNSVALIGHLNARYNPATGSAAPTSAARGSL